MQELDVIVEVDNIISQLPVSPEKLQEFRDNTANDADLQLLQNTVTQGWLVERSKVPEAIRPYFAFRDEIIYCNGLLFRGNQLVVPKVMQAEMLSHIHESHQGIIKSKQHARSVLFWPGMNSQIEDIVSQCATCAQFRKAQLAKPLISHEILDRPWSKIATDLYHLNGRQYLVLVDYYSKFPEVILLNSTKAGPVIAAMKSIFARQGIPDSVMSDNSPPFDSTAFASFARNWEFEYTTSSPGFPQSNGEVEHCIQTVKSLLKKAELARKDPFLALLEYRNTPLDGTDGYSPAEMLSSRLLRSRVPTAASLLKPHVVPPHQKNLQLRQAKQKFYHDRKSSKW